MMLAGFVGRVRLSGEDDLERTTRVVDEFREAFDVTEDQVGTLVAGKAAREAERQRVRIEHHAAGHHAIRADTFFAPAIASALADEMEQVITERETNRPKFGVGNLVD